MSLFLECGLVGCRKKKLILFGERNLIFVFKGTEPLIIFHKGEYLDVKCF